MFLYPFMHQSINQSIIQTINQARIYGYFCSLTYFRIILYWVFNFCFLLLFALGVYVQHDASNVFCDNHHDQHVNQHLYGYYTRLVSFMEQEMLTIVNTMFFSGWFFWSFVILFQVLLVVYFLVFKAWFCSKTAVIH